MNVYSIFFLSPPTDKRNPSAKKHDIIQSDILSFWVSNFINTTTWLPRLPP